MVLASPFRLGTRESYLWSTLTARTCTPSPAPRDSSDRGGLPMEPGSAGFERREILLGSWSCLRSRTLRRRRRQCRCRGTRVTLDGTNRDRLDAPGTRRRNGLLG